MNHASLFSGIGGFDLAAEWMGWNNVLSCEIDPFCNRVLEYHFPNAVHIGDIKQAKFKRDDRGNVYLRVTSHTNDIRSGEQKESEKQPRRTEIGGASENTGWGNRIQKEETWQNLGPIDIISSGFPCQPFSLAGKRRGSDDDRHLWPEMLRAIREIQPRWIVGENVFGLTNWNGGVVFREVLSDLENEGYEVQPFIIPACSVNAPHRRDRVWIVAHAKDLRNRREPGAMGKEEIKSKCKNDGAEFNSCCQNGAAADTNLQRLEKCKPTTKPGKPNGFNSETNYKRIPTWRNFPTQPPLRSRNDGFPGGLDGITVSKLRNESIKAAGNAIVPQVALQIFKAIQQYENL